MRKKTASKANCYRPAGKVGGVKLYRKSKASSKRRGKR